MSLQIDSGASVNVISESLFNSLNTTVKIIKSNMKLYPYGARNPLSVREYFYGAIEIKDNVGTAKFYIVKGTNIDSLLG